VIEQRRAGGEAMPEPAQPASGAKILGRALLDGARGIIKRENT
jgi:hypothetical protein